MTTGRLVFLLVGLTLLALLAGGCDLQPTEPSFVPSPTVRPARTPKLTPLPLLAETATPDLSTDPPQWRRASQGIPAQMGVAGVAIAPSDQMVIYLATYEPGGIYRSDDGGKTWRPASGGLETLAPIAFAVHPEHPGVAWVGTVTGAYRTSDGGQSWHLITGLPPVPIYALAASPDGAGLYAAGEAPGVWRSNDGGQTWSSGDLAGAVSSVLSLAVAGDGTTYAGTAGQGVWTSQDGGETWQRVGDALASAHVTILRPLSDGRLYALAESHLYISPDRGDTWDMVGPPQFEALSFAAGPVGSGHLYLGSKGNALAVSLDGGISWTFEGEDLRYADITWLVSDAGTPGLVYLGTRYNGLYQTTDAGKSLDPDQWGLGKACRHVARAGPYQPKSSLRRDTGWRISQRRRRR